MSRNDDWVISASSGVAWHDDHPPDVLPWLESRKSRKFMGKQDQLAVIAAGEALTRAGLRGGTACEAMGLYLTVGHIPFQRDDIDAIATSSVDADGAFSVQRFATEGIAQVNPLLTFRCLPNMPAYHVSQNFGIKGPYVVAYPGVVQAAQCLQHALDDLQAGRIAHALVGGVADQRNFLVQFFFDRSAQRQALPRADEAAMLVLESRRSALARGVVVVGGWRDIDILASAGETPHAVAAPDLFAWLHRQAQQAGAGEREFSATGLDRAGVRARCVFEARP